MPDKEIETVCPTSRKEWRAWLQKHHDQKQSVWLVYHKKSSAISGISYNDAVEEALCFGWIDSKAKPLNEEQYMQFFGKRKPGSVWSKINKARIQQLIAAGQITKAGLDVIEAVKQNGSWMALDDVEELIIPDDLAKAFQQKPNAFSYFSNLCRSDKRNILQWLVLAKRPGTRQNRITEIVDLADQQLKPKQFRVQKKSDKKLT